MKSFEQLARSGYAAYCKAHHAANHTDKPVNLLGWDHLPPNSQAAWVSVAKQIVAEMATVH